MQQIEAAFPQEEWQVRVCPEQIPRSFKSTSYNSLSPKSRRPSIQDFHVEICDVAKLL